MVNELKTATAADRLEALDSGSFTHRLAHGLVSTFVRSCTQNPPIRYNCCTLARGQHCEPRYTYLMASTFPNTHYRTSANPRVACLDLRGRSKRLEAGHPEFHLMRYGLNQKRYWSTNGSNA